jgi:hypothetical protein
LEPELFPVSRRNIKNFASELISFFSAHLTLKFGIHENVFYFLTGEKKEENLNLNLRGNFMGRNANLALMDEEKSWVPALIIGIILLIAAITLPKLISANDSQEVSGEICSPISTAP